MGTDGAELACNGTSCLLGRVIVLAHASTVIPTARELDTVGAGGIPIGIRGWSDLNVGGRNSIIAMRAEGVGVLERSAPTGCGCSRWLDRGRNPIATMRAEGAGVLGRGDGARAGEESLCILRSNG